jgi:hypothetical protein
LDGFDPTSCREAGHYLFQFSFALKALAKPEGAIRQAAGLPHTKRYFSLKDTKMTNVSKTFAILFALSGAAILPVQVFAEDTKVVVVDDSTKNAMSQCLNAALAANDLVAARDCDRFNPISPIFGNPAMSSTAKSQ